jgi:hypothetical protein
MFLLFGIQRLVLLDGRQKLADLIWLRPSGLLRVHARIAGPWRFEYVVTARCPRWADEVLGNCEGIREPDGIGILAHTGQELCDPLRDGAEI